MLLSRDQLSRAVSTPGSSFSQKRDDLRECGMILQEKNSSV
jgi:hypothetical protein